MFKIAEMKNVPVYFSKDVLFGEFESDKIVIGSLINDLSTPEKDHFVSTLLCGVEYVNSQSKEIEDLTDLDAYMLENGYNKESILSNLKSLHRILKNSEYAADHRTELLSLSQRYIRLHRMDKSTGILN